LSGAVPIEFMKTRAQTADKNFNYMKEMKNIFKTKGIKTFYTGFSMQAASEIPSYATYFYSYELIKKKGAFINELEGSQ
jgi:hypothetical protein